MAKWKFQPHREKRKWDRRGKRRSKGRGNTRRKGREMDKNDQTYAFQGATRAFVRKKMGRLMGGGGGYREKA